jgi:transferase CAF17, mitochondrial
VLLKGFSIDDIHLQQMNRLFSLNRTRALIRCVGLQKNASELLQGIITNDIGHFESGQRSIYAHFLNNQGRVLYDSILYKINVTDKDSEEFLIECDTSLVENLMKHLKFYRVRRKVDISLSDHHLWCLDSSVKDTVNNAILSCPDPRLKNLGQRIITDKNYDLLKDLPEVSEGSDEDYVAHRYKVGICEGTVDLPKEKCFPLEANCDYMHGVSFHKGCYIGQELTARTHHTGVVRKRLMPVIFEKPFAIKNHTEVLEVVNEEKKSVGKLRNAVESCGLGLIRIDQALAAKELFVNENKCKVEKPFWWPIEAEKTPRPK